MNSRSRLGWTFAITSLALFAFALDRLVVAIALPAIRADLGAQVSGLTSVAYLRYLLQPHLAIGRTR